MLGQTLKRLARMFTVRDIMIPQQNLVCAMDVVSARGKLDHHHDFNLIPILDERQRITSYLERGKQQPEPIDLHAHIVSDSTEILDLVDSLETQTFCFVLTKRNIEGYVHFSDLNNRFVEITFYVIIQAVENHFIERIRPFVVDNSIMDEVLGPERAGMRRKRFYDLQRKDANLNLLGVMTMDDIFKYARRYIHVDLGDDDIKAVYKVRNALAHGPGRLVTKHADVAQLVMTKQKCLTILQSKTGDTD